PGRAREDRSPRRPQAGPLLPRRRADADPHPDRNRRGGARSAACREDLGEDVTRQRHRLGKFLLRHGRIWREGRPWTLRHWTWLRAEHFDDPTAQRTCDEYLAQLDF